VLGREQSVEAQKRGQLFSLLLNRPAREIGSCPLFLRAAHCRSRFRFSSNSLKMRLYSSAQLSGRTNP